MILLGKMAFRCSDCETFVHLRTDDEETVFFCDCGISVSPPIRSFPDPWVYTDKRT